MFRLLYAILLCTIAYYSCAQYYVQGEVRNEQGKLTPNAKILLSSKGNCPFSSGNQGIFGIPISVKSDTILVIMEGYDTCKQLIETGKYQILQLKQFEKIAPLPLITSHLSSITKNRISLQEKISFHNEETYNNLIENTWTNSLSYPQNGFSLTIDNASYSNIRRFINQQSVVPANAVRIEEMLNYFNLNHNKNDNTSHFSCNTFSTQAPWNKNNLLYFINIQAPKINLDNIAPCKLVFLIDVSGSMGMPNRLPLIQSALKLLTTNLREKDTISIVVYGGQVGIALQPTSGKEKDSINNIIDQLTASGDTPGESALRIAYELAEKNYNARCNNRVIIATDGDFNIGESSEEELEKLISKHTQSGVYLTCLGVGMGNYKDSKLEALAKRGNGNFVYIDKLQEAEKTFITEFTKTMYSVADNASMQVHFNSNVVKEYRLIGFDNKNEPLTRNLQQLEGGEIGSGHSLMAVYEIIPSIEIVDNTLPIASLELQYTQPGSRQKFEQHFNTPSFYTSLATCDSVFRLAASIVMFGQLLKNSPYSANYSWKELIQFTNTTINKNIPVQKEFLDLVMKAKKLYPSRIKKSTKVPDEF